MHAAWSTTAGTSSVNAATRRLLPIPASPTTTAWWGRPDLDDPVERRLELGELGRAPDQRGRIRGRTRTARADAEQPAVGVELERLATEPSSDGRELDLVRARVVQRAARTADDRSHEHGACVIDEQPPRPDRQPRLDVAASEDLAQLDRRACGANDVVLVRPVRAEGRDQLHARLR